MLLLLFRTGDQLFAVEARRVAQVLPRVPLRPIPHAPRFLAGLLPYRGVVVPVVDFGILLGLPAGRDLLSTRIILTEIGGGTAPTRWLGIVAEDVNRVEEVDPSRIGSAGMGLDEAPYLGRVVRLDDAYVQLVEADRVLDDRLQAALLGDRTESG